jgi:predicted amidohydrolase
MVVAMRAASSCALLAVGCVTAALALPATSSEDPSASYRAAVVQFAPARVPNRTLTHAEAYHLQMANVDRMSTWMAAAKANGSQIVIFPESAIGSCPGDTCGDEGWTRDSIVPFLEAIPEPTSPPTVLCDDPAAALHAPVSAKLSCLARQHRIVAVFDLGDVQTCEAAPVAGGCRADGRAQFNTAVAFDSDGALLEKYHKHHLFKEEGWFDVDADLTKKGRFEAFGVKFGLFICYDIEFEREEPHDGQENASFCAIL